MRAISKHKLVGRLSSILLLVAAAVGFGPRPPGVPSFSAPTDSLASFSAGIGGTCLTTTSGAGYCWGEFDRTPGVVFRIVDSTGRPAALQSLSQGWLNRCGLSVTGDVVCDSELSGRTSGTRAPCRARHCLISLGSRGQLPDPPLKAVATGSDHACALAFDGVAYCWGHNQMGQLGNGTRAPDPDASTGEPVRAPVAVPSLRFSQISAGEMLTCGITTVDAAVYCWGYGQSGQTGDTASMRTCDGPVPNQDEPCSTALAARVAPEGIPGTYAPQPIRFASVSAGQRLACAVSTTYEAYCWGTNYRCALGRCRAPDSPVAHLIGVPGRVVEVGAGYFHACARTADQRVFCWGNNTGGELGSLSSVNSGPDGLPPDYRANSAGASAAYSDPCFLGGRCSPVPIEVAPGKRWAGLAVGPTHNCALAADDGGVYCWGGNNRGLLGTGMTLVTCDNRSVQWKSEPCQPRPTKVPGLPSLGPPRPRSIEQQLARTPGAPEPSSLGATRLAVSRREMRIMFPPESSQAWGWATRSSPEFGPGSYNWRIGLSGLEAPTWFSVEVPRSESSRRFASLDEMIASSHPRVCRGATPCMTVGKPAVDRGRVTLTISDSTLIAELFGMRPETFGAMRMHPDGRAESANTIRIEYENPQIPPPSAATRGRAAAEGRRYKEENQWVARGMSVAGVMGWSPDAWLEVGDSLTFTVSDALCFFDTCGQPLAVEDSAWAVEDSTIVRVRRVDTREPGSSRRGGFRVAGPQARVVALRPGETTVRAVGLHGQADTVAARTRPSRVVERKVVVIPPVKAVRFVERPQLVRIGDTLRVNAKAFDAADREVPGVPISIRVTDAHDDNTFVRSPLATTFATPGTRRIVATFGHHTDTLMVVAFDPKVP